MASNYFTCFQDSHSFILAFFLFARKSNIVPPSHCKFNKCKHLCRRDIMIDKNQVVIYIKWSKTIQVQDRYLLIPLVHIPGSPLYPRSAVLNMFKLVPATPDDPASVFSSNAGLQTLTHQSFTSQLRSLLKMTGHNPSRYSGHSFWRGGASFALASGGPGRINHDTWGLEVLVLFEVLG